MIQIVYTKLPVAFAFGTCGVPMGSPRGTRRRRRSRDTGVRET